MAKKKKEICPYCGKSFAYLSRHKCKIKERVEGVVDDKTQAERRIERIEEKKRDLNRNLKKDERFVLNLINRRKDLFFKDLLELTGKKKNDLEEILEILNLQSKIKMRRELLSASWTKHIFSIEDYDAEFKGEKTTIDKNQKDFIWNLFSRQPCFICPYIDKCNETNLDIFNPFHCSWLTNWIETSLQGKKFIVNFEDIEE